MPDDAFESNYAEEPAADGDEALPAEAAPTAAADAGGEEGGDE